MFELAAKIRNQAREHVQPSRGAFGIGFAGDVRREIQLFYQRRHVRATALEHRRARQIDLVQMIVLQFVDDPGIPAGKEAGADAIRHRTDPQVEAGGLQLFGSDGRVCCNVPGGNQFFDGLARQNARGV